VFSIGNSLIIVTCTESPAAVSIAVLQVIGWHCYDHSLTRPFMSFPQGYHAGYTALFNSYIPSRLDGVGHQ